jgi:DNA-directed RNA polymerase subunit beta
LNIESIIRKEKEFIEKGKRKINFINVTKKQTISTATSLVPFFEHNDGNRTLMGSAMQRQAINIKGKEAAIVQTGLEKNIIKNSSFASINKKSGLIKFISKKKLILYTHQSDKKMKINNTSMEKKIKLKLNDKTKLLKTRKNFYSLKDNLISHQNTYIEKFVSHTKGKWIKKGEILNEEKKKNKAKLTIGKNLLIGYMIWEGYNFEDAIVVNQRLQEEGIFTSNYIKKHRTFLIKNEIGKVRKLLFLNIKKHKNEK